MRKATTELAESGVVEVSRAGYRLSNPSDPNAASDEHDSA
jgi:hypothetical protein